MNTPAWEALRAFRHQVYNTGLGCRRDALFEMLDAVLTVPTLETPAHLSLAATCRRGWGSLYDALKAGTMDQARLETLVASYALESQTSWYAVDASVWPRCDAETSPERGYYHHPYRPHIAMRMANPSWLDGTMRGSCRCLSGAQAGPRPCVSDASSLESISI